ncbi:hypothetical protein T439DRAFT_382639 [Meredithblackwellia eburnea MCA 4105]
MMRRRCFFVKLPAALIAVVLLYILPQEGAAFMHSSRKKELAALTKDTWLHAYKAYKRVAFPSDEVLPLSCRAQGHDRINPENVGVNDVMGDFSLTLVDSLDAFAILGDREGFENAVREVIQHVSFDRDSRVQVFEVTIRMLGGLLSGHMLATNPKRGYALKWYDGELLTLAHDLGRRLLPAFQTPTGIPFPRIHLQHGVRRGETTETCAAGAGSLLLEFGVLSRLTGDSRFEEVARKAFFATWNRRSDINLLGNTINAFDGKWMHGVSSTGAGIDSFFEYAAKAYVMFGDDEWWRVWDEAYSAIMRHIRAPDGFWYRGANMHSGQLASVLVDSLSAFFPGVQTLVGDLEAAIKAHAVYAFQWKRYSGLPELFDINRRTAVQLGYPLRPEFIESNLYLYQATKDEFYLEVAEQALHDINNRTRVPCGLAAVLDLSTGALEDKQPSFVTSETLKYLYLTFDEANPYNHDDSNMVYTTEGHMLELDTRPVLGRKRRRTPSEALSCPAYDPASMDRHQHPLSLSVARRTDFEHARYLAGFIVPDERKEVEDGRWSESGVCELPTSEDYHVELLFASSTDVEDVAPGSSKVRQGRDGTVHITSISGLRFSLTRAWPGGAGEGFVVSRIAQYRIPVGSFVRIADPAVLATLPPLRVEKVHLNFTFTQSPSLPSLMSNPSTSQKENRRDRSDDSTTLIVPALAASFGPSIASAGASRGSFAFSQPALPVRVTGYQFGCEPHHDLLPVISPSPTPSSIGQKLVNAVVESSGPRSALDGQVIILRRGMCSFARKSHLAALAGAKAVIVVNNSDDEAKMVVPSADGEEDMDMMKVLVPLVLVSNSTGATLDRILRLSSSVGIGIETGEGEGGVASDGEAAKTTVAATVRPEEAKTMGVEPIVLGGYTVLNVLLERK